VARAALQRLRRSTGQGQALGEAGRGEWGSSRFLRGFLCDVATGWDGRAVEEEEQWVGAPLTGGPSGWAAVRRGQARAGG
jgi:hypothetical protein